jgi:glutamyl-tRNA reductase
MNFYNFGVNHKTAPIEIREKVYLSPIEQELLLSELKSNPSILEAFVLSTCNRTEVYLNVIDEFIPFDYVHRLIAGIKKIPDFIALRSYFYAHHQRDAVEHLFRVTAGLDSMMLGERQILGQVKESVERARKSGMFSRKFNILSNLAIRAGKKAQTETQISFGGSSVSWAGIVKAEEMLGTLTDKSILIIGTGKMGELAVGQIQNKGFKKLYLMNRTEANAKAVAKKYSGEAVSFLDMKDVLTQVDVCICSVGAPHYILEKSTMQKIMPIRQNRPIVLIDLSMPRNIDPASAEVEGVQLFEIDDLKEVVDSSMKIRQDAVPEVLEIINGKVAEFYEKIARAAVYDSALESDVLESINNLP